MAGGVGAVVAGRAIAGQLYGVSPADPLSFVIAAFVLGVVALAAALLPTAQALRVDPVTALRAD